MKNLILSLAVLITGLTPALANGSNDDSRAEKVFAKQFTGAENVKWTKLNDGYLRVTFVLNGIGAESFFDANAELLGTVRNLFYNQLPLSVIQKVSKKFTDPVITEVKEITNAEGTSYKIVLEQKGKKYYLRMNNLGEITDLQKENLKK